MLFISQRAASRKEAALQFQVRERGQRAQIDGHTMHHLSLPTPAVQQERRRRYSVLAVPVLSPAADLRRGKRGTKFLGTRHPDGPGHDETVYAVPKQCGCLNLILPRAVSPLQL